jgi:glucosamine--fructose-6-phosphate aminotransferase (isomerizing)
MGENSKEAPRWVGGIEPAKELLTATGIQILEIECRTASPVAHGLRGRPCDSG